jgi:hypothetical protein
LARILIDRYPLPSEVGGIQSAIDAKSTDISSEPSTAKNKSGDK